jgi:phosphoglycolate phosphatase
MPLKFVIFDLDGTLVDTSRDLADALSYAVSPWGLDPFGPDETKPLVGEGIDRLILKALVPMGKEDAERHAPEAMRRFVKHYSENLTTHSRPYEGVDETLRELSNAFGLAVLSNKRTAMCEGILKNLGLAEHFLLIAGGDTVPEKKPSVLAARYVLDTLGAQPEETALVGDSSIDIQTAKAAGIFSVAVPYGFRPRETLTGTDRLVESFPALTSLLAEISETAP